MADSSVTLEVILEGKNLKIVQKNVDKVTSSVNKASKATENLSNRSNSYNKGQKGVAQATSNSTKAFSKMRSEIGGGSSGLVGAYATLAANLFAATAAFNALRASSKVEELARGLELVGINAGRNLPKVAEGLREITNNAISTEQALRTAAIATSANFSDDQLQRLTKVAKGASLALGRDLGDALDRLVRGTAKLEPEILDELGIFVRLDDAVAAYAITLGKTSEQLTDFERRQAFLNTAVEKGEERFSALADELDTNPYDKLGASFANLTKTIVTSLNNGILPVINYLSNNLTALGGSLLVVGSGVAKQVASTFVSTAASASQAASALQEQNKELRSNLETTDKLPAKYLSVNEKIKAGTASIQDYKTGLTSLDDSVQTHTRQLNKWETEGKKTTEQLDEKRQKLSNVKNTYGNLRKELIVTTAAQANFTKAQALGAIQNFQLLTGLKLSYEAVKIYASGTWAAAKGAGALTIANSILKISFFGLGVVVAGVFTTLLTLLPVIGLIIAFGPQLLDWAKNKFFPESVIREKTENLLKNLDIIDEAVDRQTKNQEKALKDAAGTAKSIAGLLTEITNNVTEAAELDAAASKKRQEEIDRETEALNKLLQIERERAAEKMYDPTQIGRIEEIDRRRERIKELSAEEKDASIARKTQIESITLAIKKLQDKINDPSKQEIIPQSVVNKLKEQREALLDNTITLEQFQKSIEEIKTPFIQLEESIEAVGTKSSEFNKELNKISAKTNTPYDALINKAVELQNELQAVTDRAAILNGVVTDGAAAAQANQNLNSAGFANKDELDAYISSMQTIRTKYLEFPGIIKKQEVALARISKIGKEDSNLLKEQLRQEVELLNTKKAQLDNEENFINTAIRNGEASDAQVARLVDLGNERLKIEEQLLDRRTYNEQLRAAEIKDEEKLLKLRNKTLKNNMETQKLNLKSISIEREIALATSNRDAYTAKEQLAFFLQEKKARQDLIDQELIAKQRVIVLEFDRQNAELLLLDARARITNQELSNYEELRDQILRVSKSASEAAVEEAKVKRKNLELEEALLKRSVNQAKERSKTAKKLKSDPKADAEARRKEYLDIIADATLALSDIMDEFRKSSDELTSIMQLSLEQLLPFIQALTDVLTVAFQPLLDILEGLGPDGKYISSMIEGTLQMSQAFQDFARPGELTDKLGAIASVLGAIGSIAKAGADARVAGIDREIEAERKRDGQSEASLKKISSLEARKEKEKKKAFETNKKIAMAQASIATLVAAMEAYKALAGIYIVGPALAAAAAGAITAVGLKTVSLIASQSYQGGGSASAGQAREISVGQTSNRIDVSQRATGEELSTLRGGNVSDIQGKPPTPAFMGAKYRAQGGPTAGYVVGEQGPELFVPETPGRIIPNDEMVRQSQPMNINFNVQAIDASSFNDALTTQRGNIISMIREAANTYGEPFLEGVNDSAINAGGGKI